MELNLELQRKAEATEQKRQFQSLGVSNKRLLKQAMKDEGRDSTVTPRHLQTTISLLENKTPCFTAKLRQRVPDSPDSEFPDFSEHSKVREFTVTKRVTRSQQHRGRKSVKSNSKGSILGKRPFDQR